MLATLPASVVVEAARDESGAWPPAPGWQLASIGGSEWRNGRQCADRCEQAIPCFDQLTGLLGRAAGVGVTTFSCGGEAGNDVVPGAVQSASNTNTLVFPWKVRAVLAMVSGRERHSKFADDWPPRDEVGQRQGIT